MVEVGRLSRPMHCNKGVQPMPTAVYCGGCRDKLACLCWDSILASLLPQTTVIIVDVLCLLWLSQATVHRGIIGTG